MTFAPSFITIWAPLFTKLIGFCEKQCVLKSISTNKKLRGNIVIVFCCFMAKKVDF